MSANSKIEWTDATWNPVTGCTKVSAGCQHCYAENWAKRHLGEFSKDHARKFGDVMCHQEKLDIPIRWKKPRRIFVNSMSDLFHETVPDEFIDQVFAVMALCPQHTFQILTKRPERMQKWFNWTPRSDWPRADFVEHELAEFGSVDQSDILGAWPLPNVWLGVSVEDQRAADERIPLLLQTPAAVRFLSCEPLLGPVDLSVDVDSLTGCSDDDVPNQVDWVICGGESGPHARPMHPAWARSLRDQCTAASVPFFFKQWGEWAPYDRGGVDSKSLANPGSLDTPMGKVGKRLAGRLLDGREWNEFPSTHAQRSVTSKDVLQR